MKLETWTTSPDRVAEIRRVLALRAATRTATKLATEELQRAFALFPPVGMHSAHEGFAVLAEEVDELWDEVKRKAGPERDEALRKEAVQVAAMALRFLVEVCHV